jgi:AcrR family transcriptional regulator
MLMDAAETLIAERGYASATPAAIGKAAGLGEELMRVFFPQEGAMLRALHERFSTQATRLAVEAAEGAVYEKLPVVACVERVATSLVEAMFARPALLRAVLASGDAKLIDAHRKMLGAVASRVGRAFDALPDRPAPKDLALALIVAMAVAHDAILASDGPPRLVVGAIELSSEAVLAEVCRVVRGTFVASA